MTLKEAVRTCFSKYVTFSGRASRSEYWYFVLFVILGSIACSILDTIFFGSAMVETGPGEFSASTSSNGPINAIFSLATLLPSLSAGWRRMHDTGRSGFFLLYPLIVMIGIFTFVGFLSGFPTLMAGDFSGIIGGTSSVILFIAVIVLIISPLLVLWWLTRPSQPGTNTFGPNPHEVTP